MKRIIVLGLTGALLLSTGILTTSCKKSGTSSVDKRLKKKSKLKGSTGCPIKDC